MARLMAHCDGAEWGDLAFWTVVNTVAVESSIKRSGDYSYKVTVGNGGSKEFGGTLAEWYHRFAFYHSMNSGASTILQYRDMGDTCIEIKFDASSGLLSAWAIANNGSAVCRLVGTKAVRKDEWTLVEVHAARDAASGVFALRVNGVDAGSFSGDTLYGSTRNVNNYRFMAGSSTAYYLDDLAIDDAAWCGDGQIVLLRADGNGDASQWAGSDGDSVDNYLLYDDPVPDGDATYIEDDTGGRQDMATYADYDGTDKEIRYIWASARGRGTATGQQVKLGFKLGGTVYLSGALDLMTVVNYSPLEGSGYAVCPATSAAWTEADVDGGQVVVETV